MIPEHLATLKPLTEEEVGGMFDPEDAPHTCVCQVCRLAATWYRAEALREAAADQQKFGSCRCYGLQKRKCSHCRTAQALFEFEPKEVEDDS